MKVDRSPAGTSFVVFDLEGAPSAYGVVRLAPKVLVDGAGWLARATTYTYASFGVQAGGASAGVDAKPETRTEALAGFIDQVSGEIAGSRLRLTPAKGVTDADLAALGQISDGAVISEADAAAARAAGVLGASRACFPELEGRTFVLDVLDPTTTPIALALLAEGAILIAASVGGKGYVAAAPPAAADLSATLAEGGAAGLEALGWREVDATEVLTTGCDALLVGSRVGVVDHAVAARVTASTLVGWGALPVTAKGLATLERAGTRFVPDFLAGAGPALVAAHDGTGALDLGRISSSVTEVVGSVVDQPGGPFTAACERAEEFLLTWRDELPFGRPLA